MDPADSNSKKLPPADVPPPDDAAASLHPAEFAVGLPLDEHDPYAALRVPAFRRYLAGNFLSILGLQMQTTAVLWEINRRTGDALMLGLVGLVQVVPVISLALLAGHVADRFNRKYVILAALITIAAASAGLAIVSSLQAPVVLMYACLFVAGIGRAFQQPAKASFVPQLVPRRAFPNAVTWNAAAFQMAAVLGPALSGAMIALFESPSLVFQCDAAAALAFGGLLLGIRYHRPVVKQEPLALGSFAAGIQFVARNKVILGAIGLDMFGVLLGGAVALLPIYAEQILHVGPVGFGCLQAAPAVGAICMSLWMSHRPPLRHAGRALLWAVAGFGVATIVFGVSRNFPLSLAMLFTVGALDNISVVVRHSVVQLLTPDSMRGRVSAINGMFISISNELGAFESGTVAWLFTPVISVVSGGVGTLIVVAAVAWLFPQLRRYGRLDGGEPEK